MYGSDVVDDDGLCLTFNANKSQYLVLSGIYSGVVMEVRVQQWIQCTAFHTIYTILYKSQHFFYSFKTIALKSCTI